MRGTGSSGSKKGEREALWNETQKPREKVFKDERNKEAKGTRK